MNTQSILNSAQLIKNDRDEITSIAISLRAYNYLCIAAKKMNIFSSSNDVFLEMDVSVFLDLLTKASMFESEIHDDWSALRDMHFLQVV